MLNLRKYFLFSFFALLMCSFAVAQNNRPMKTKSTKPKIAWKDSIYYGGNLGLQVSGNGSLVDLSPNVGYKFNKFASVGLQGIFTNLSIRYNSFTYRYMFYGAGAFVRIKPLPFLFFQAEYDVLSVPDNFSVSSPKRTIADVSLAGLGLRNQMGPNSCYYLLLMYEFAPTPNSPYTYGPFNSPLVYRAGFNINF
jgi:hypothetical protein